MTKLLFFFISIFFPLYINAQSVEAVYDVQMDLSGNLSQPINSKIQLTYSLGVSLQKQFLNQGVSNNILDKENNKVRFTKIGNDTTYIFKDFVGKRMLTKESVYNKLLDVVDDINIFNWKIETDTLIILNYQCRKATTTHRGRDYVAYYAESIPISDGPWKFNGLPGLILKVTIENSNSFFQMEISELRIQKETIDLKNPYNGKKLIPFAEYKKMYNKKYDELDAYSQSISDGNTTVKTPRGGIELLTDD